MSHYDSASARRQGRPLIEVIPSTHPGTRISYTMAHTVDKGIDAVAAGACAELSPDGIVAGEILYVLQQRGTPFGLRCTSEGVMVWGLK